MFYVPDRKIPRSILLNKNKKKYVKTWEQKLSGDHWSIKLPERLQRSIEK